MGWDGMRGYVSNPWEMNRRVRDANADADADDPSKGPDSNKKGNDIPSQNINPQAFP